MIDEAEIEKQERHEQQQAAQDTRLNVPMPAAPESEVVMLGLVSSMTLETYSQHARRLRADLFLNEGRRAMFLLMQEWHVHGRELGMEAVLPFTSELRLRGELDKVGGPAEVTEVFCQALPQSGDLIERELGNLESMRARRVMIKTAWSIAAAAHDTTVPWKAAVEKAEGDLFNLHEQSSRRGTIHIRERVPDVMEEIDTAFRNRGHVTSGMALGFTDLDRMTMGLKTGLFVIAARPSRGKTVLACQTALNVGAGVGRTHYHEFNQPPLPVLFFSLETTDRALTRRMLLNQWGVPISKARQGTMDRTEMQSFHDAGRGLMASQIYLHESFGMTIQELRAQARIAVARHGIRLILVDYLQLLTSSSKAAQYSRQAMIAEVSTGLKHLAHEFDLPVIALAQLNREGDSKRPSMADLRESGQIEQDADYIAMICDPPEHLTQPDENGVPPEHEYMAVDLVKNKDGPTTTDASPMVLYFDKSVFRLRSWTDSLLSNNPDHYQAGYNRPTQGRAKQDKKNHARQSAGESLKDVFPDD